jgi:alkylation response protein AidB-like acyl-CoA dehydrogenase
LERRRAGYLSDIPIEGMMRDAKITQIFEGANEIHKLILAKAAWGAANSRV